MQNRTQGRGDYGRSVRCPPPVSTPCRPHSHVSATGPLPLLPPNKTTRDRAESEAIACSARAEGPMSSTCVHDAPFQRHVSPCRPPGPFPPTRSTYSATLSTRAHARAERSGQCLDAVSRTKKPMRLPRKAEHRVGKARAPLSCEPRSVDGHLADELETSADGMRRVQQATAPGCLSTLRRSRATCEVRQAPRTQRRRLTAAVTREMSASTRNDSGCRRRAERLRGMRRRPALGRRAVPRVQSSVSLGVPPNRHRS